MQVKVVGVLGAADGVQPLVISTITEIPTCNEECRDVPGLHLVREAGILRILDEVIQEIIKPLNGFISPSTRITDLKDVPIMTSVKLTISHGREVPLAGVQTRALSGRAAIVANVDEVHAAHAARKPQ